MKDKNLDFSFSGLKTAVLYALEDLNEEDYADVAASFQEAVIDALTTKLTWAVQDTKICKLVCSGGVASNKLLRERLKQMAINNNLEVSYPRMEFCTDNAAMIAYAGFIRKKFKLPTYPTNFARPRWPLGELYD
jgi:N6-L-threonylcarbamoyladenine synthase